MKARIALSVLFALLFAAGTGFSSARREGVATAMAGAARAFLEGLDEAQRVRASLAFDSPARTDWHFVPRARPGLAVGELDPEDRARFEALLGTGLSAQGKAKWNGVLRLEAILRELESRPNAPATWRDPALYHVAIFGVPGTDPWGWRLEGHHWSVHFTSVDAEVLAVTPSFVGANPARVAKGEDAGFELLGPEDALARAFAKTLSAEQLDRARLPGERPDDVLLDPAHARIEGAPQGLRASELAPEQAKALSAIVERHFADLSPELAERERARFARHDQADLRFAWAGEAKEGPWYWRVQGAYFAIELVHARGDLSHVHRMWRDFERDLGGDPLRAHLAKDH